MIIKSNKYFDDIIRISDNKDILTIQSPFSKYLVYLKENEVIGFCYYYEIYDRLEIAYIFVKNEFRNNKIASSLLEYLIENNKEKELFLLARKVDFDVDSDIARIMSGKERS